jgi:hypothetical protein
MLLMRPEDIYPRARRYISSVRTIQAGNGCVGDMRRHPRMDDRIKLHCSFLAAAVFVSSLVQRKILKMLLLCEHTITLVAFSIFAHSLGYFHCKILRISQFL